MGTNGLAPDTRRKCPDAPTKRPYHSLDEAWDAARKRSEEAKLTIVPYACPGCGYYHLTKKVDGSDIAVMAPVGITTGALRSKPGFQPRLVEAVERENVTPITPGNPEARHKALAEFLDGRTTVTSAEVGEILGIQPTSVARYMVPLGWKNTKGRKARWVAPTIVSEPNVSAADLLRGIRKAEGRTLHEVAPEELIGKVQTIRGGRVVYEDPPRPEPIDSPQRLSIPVSNHNGRMRNIEMLVPGPLSEAEWTQMHKILNAMKPALVEG